MIAVDDFINFHHIHSMWVRIVVILYQYETIKKNKHLRTSSIRPPLIKNRMGQSFFLNIWRFPEMGVPPNHPNFTSNFHEINHPAINRYPRNNIGNLQMFRRISRPMRLEPSSAPTGLSALCLAQRRNAAVVQRNASQRGEAG